MATVTRGEPVKRNVGIAPHLDAWLRSFAQVRGLSYAGAVNTALLEGLTRLDPGSRDFYAPRQVRPNDVQ